MKLFVESRKFMNLLFFEELFFKNIIFFNNTGDLWDIMQDQSVGNYGKISRAAVVDKEKLHSYRKSVVGRVSLQSMLLGVMHREMSWPQKFKLSYGNH